MRLGTLAVLLCLLIAGPAQAAGLVGTRARLERAMEQAGPRAAALVVEVESGRRLLSWRPGTRLVPASVTKLYTSAAVLERLGPEARLPTDVLATAPLDVEGIVAGDLVLRGGGDPTLGKAQLRQLAEQLAFEQGLTEVRGRIVGDESLFDTRRGPPSSRYRVSRWVGVLSALAYRPASAGLTGRPALAAARALRTELRRAGVTVRGKATTGVTPAEAVTVLRLVSPTVAALVQGMNRPSDNFSAETLLKVLGAADAGRGTTAAGAAAVRRAIARLGARPRVVDGSGLSRVNRTSPREVVTLLRAMARRESGSGLAFRDSLAVAGRNGTLEDRMRRSPARDDCVGKTGTLLSVSALAGYCVTPGGREVAYAFLMNGVWVPGARALQDRMLGVLAEYTG